MIYLDNAATTFPKPKEIKVALVDFLEKYGANAGRSGHMMSIEAGRVIYEARESVANLINLSSPLRVAFTLNATHSINLAINGVVKEGDIVVTSPYEHNSVKRVLNFLSQSKGVSIRVLKTDSDGHIVDFKDTLKGAKLLCLTHANNVSGAIMPIREIFSAAKNEGVITLLDAAQSLGVLDIDMVADKIDLLCSSGHKGLFGIQGTGILATNLDMSEFIPYMQGGTGSKSELEFQPNFMPDMLESGTQNGHGIATVGAGVEFIKKVGLDKIYNHEFSFREFLVSEISGIKGVKILTPPRDYKAIANLSIISDSFNPSQLANRLEAYGFLTRASLHCNPSTHKFYGTFPDGALRISPGYFNTIDEMESLVGALKEVLK